MPYTTDRPVDGHVHTLRHRALIKEDTTHVVQSSPEMTVVVGTDASRQQAEHMELHAVTLLPDKALLLQQQQQRSRKQKKRELDLKDLPVSMQQQQQPAKKRQRKGSTGAPLVMTQEQSDHIDEVVNAVADLGAGSLCSTPEPSLPQLSLLPGLSLQEPNVRLSHHAFPITGAEIMTGELLF